MPRGRKLSFAECLAMMRKRNALTAEEGFHELLPRAHEHAEELIAAFKSDQDHAMQCWLLELIGEARSEAAFPLLCEQAASGDVALRGWGVHGLKLLNTHEARKFLFENGLR